MKGISSIHALAAVEARREVFPVPDDAALELRVGRDVGAACDDAAGIGKKRQDVAPPGGCIASERGHHRRRQVHVEVLVRCPDRLPDRGRRVYDFGTHRDLAGLDPGHQPIAKILEGGVIRGPAGERGAREEADAREQTPS